MPSTSISMLVLFAYLSIFTLLCWGQIQFTVGFCKDGRLLHKKMGGRSHLVWCNIEIILLHPCVAAMPSPYWVMNTAMCCGAWWCSWLKVQDGFLCIGIGCCFICHVCVLQTSGDLREVVLRVYISSWNWFHVWLTSALLSQYPTWYIFFFIYGNCYSVKSRQIIPLHISVWSCNYLRLLSSYAQVEAWISAKYYVQLTMRFVNLRNWSCRWVWRYSFFPFKIEWQI